MAFFFQTLPQQVSQPEFVFDYQDLHSGSSANGDASESACETQVRDLCHETQTGMSVLRASRRVATQHAPVRALRLLLLFFLFLRRIIRMIIRVLAVELSPARAV